MNQISTLQSSTSTSDEFLNRAVAEGHSLIPRMATFDREVFQRDFEAKGQPVILENCMTEWKAFRQWTPDFLKEKFGSSVCHASINLPKGVPGDGLSWPDFTEWMELRKFVDFMRTTDKPCYMQQVPQGLIGDLSEWCAFDEITEMGNHNVFINVFLGSDDTNSSLHYDMPENFLAQMHGAKQVYLFHPDQRRHIPTYPDSLRMSTVDPYNPDLKTYPDYAKARGMVGVINAGDMVYIPKVWWHQLRSVGESISVNCWYGREESSMYLLKVAAAGGIGHFARPALDFLRYGVLGLKFQNRLFGDVPTGKWFFDILVDGVRRRFRPAGTTA